MGETFLFSHYHNPLLPFTTKLWSVSVLPYLLFILQSYWTQFSAFIMPQKLFQQRLPKPPKYQTQWAFHGILMWPLYSNLTLVAHSFLHLFFLLVLLPLLFGSFTSSFFHQLLEYPSRHGGFVVLFSSHRPSFIHMWRITHPSPLFWAPHFCV